DGAGGMNVDQTARHETGDSGFIEIDPDSSSHGEAELRAEAPADVPARSRSSSGVPLASPRAAAVPPPAPGKLAAPWPARVAGQSHEDAGTDQPIRPALPRQPGLLGDVRYIFIALAGSTAARRE